MKATSSVLEALPVSDREAVARLFQEHEAFLRGIVRRYLASADRSQLDSADIVQSVWVQLLQRVKAISQRFDDEEGLKAFLLRAVRNRFIDHDRRIRARKKRELLVATARQHQAPPRPSELARASELWERMKACCPPRHLIILEMKRQGRTLDEIASHTGLHPGSVRRILYDLARRLAVGSLEKGDEEE